MGGGGGGVGGALARQQFLLVCKLVCRLLPSGTYSDKAKMLNWLLTMDLFVVKKVML